jgi:hypothetical protein
MPATTNKPEIAKEAVPVKSAEEAQLEYKRLLEQYQRLRDEVEVEIRRMRGGRVLSLEELFARIFKRKREAASASK